MRKIEILSILAAVVVFAIPAVTSCQDTPRPQSSAAVRSSLPQIPKRLCTTGFLLEIDLYESVESARRFYPDDVASKQAGYYGEMLELAGELRAVHQSSTDTQSAFHAAFAQHEAVITAMAGRKATDEFTYEQRTAMREVGRAYLVDVAKASLAAGRAGNWKAELEKLVTKKWDNDDIDLQDLVHVCGVVEAKPARPRK